MFTVNTQIPTAVRAQIRALVKSHVAWPGHIQALGILSSQAKNSDILAFALQHSSLANQVNDILMNLGLGMGNASQPVYVDIDDEDESEARDIAASPVDVASYDVSSVLGAVDQFLSPLVRDELSKALAPVIDAANAKQATIEVEKTVYVEVAPGETPKPVKPKARPGKQVTFRSLFPSRAKDAWNDQAITLWDGAASPAIDPFYVVDREQMATVLTAFECNANVWAFGPPGTGKSTIFQQAAANVGRPFVKIGMTRQTDIEGLVGGMALRNGATVWEDGVLTAAMRQPGTIILIDELTLAPAGVQAIIQLVADDHRTLSLPTGEVVKAAHGVVFCVADNTNGAGDDGGLYAGTNVSNSACVTRFKRMLPMDYLSPQQEAEAIANHTACPVAAARKLTDFAAQIRRLPDMQGVVLSIRQMVGFVQMVQQGFSGKSAFVTTISSRMPATEKAVIETVATLAWRSEFEDAIHGRASSPAPSDSAASQAFAPEHAKY